jgi:serine/threonine protein kinase
MRYRPGTLLADRFRLRAHLAHGGMGELWLADHLGLKSEVVVKFISAALSSRPGAAERFAREAAAAAQVNSPHVVKILDYGASPDGVPFIVMEKLEGRDLAATLTESGSLPPESVARVVRQLAKALMKAHAASIVHRDIKPANVFVCATEGELFVKLLDFGVAKTAETVGPGATVSGMCVGTAGYMSPEQILASKEVDFRSDLWSLGVLAFHCLTGRRPFNGDTPAAVLLSIKTLALPQPSRFAPLPNAVDAWFEQACAWEPAERFASALEMANALSSALSAMLEPLTVDVEEAPRARAQLLGDKSLDAVPATVALAGTTRSAQSPARGDSLLKVPPAGVSPSRKRRSRLALAMAAAVAVVVVGGGYARSRAAARLVPVVAPAPSSDSPAQVSARAIEHRAADDAPLPSSKPQPLVEESHFSPRSIGPTQRRADVGHKPRLPPAFSSTEVAARPAAATSATAPAISETPSPAPSVSAAVDKSRLFVMPDARF